MAVVLIHNSGVSGSQIVAVLQLEVCKVTVNVSLAYFFVAS